jgi:hypothetical protein
MGTPSCVLFYNKENKLLLHFECQHANDKTYYPIQCVCGKKKVTFHFVAVKWHTEFF